ICLQVLCECKTVSLRHHRNFNQINEVMEKIKKTVQQEIEEKASEAIDEASEQYKEELQEQVIKHALANTGAEGFAYATPVLMAFYATGKIIGETIAWQIENFFSAWFDYIHTFNEGTYNPQMFQMNGYDCAPGTDRYKKHVPPGWWGRLWQEAPFLTDTWEIVVDCNDKDTGPKWVNPDDPDYVLEEEKDIVDPGLEKDKDYVPLPEKVKDHIGQQQQEWINLIEQRHREEEQEYEQWLIGVKQRAEEFRKDCPICDPIRQQIFDILKEIEQRQQELQSALEKLKLAEGTLKQRTLEREAYEQDLAHYRDPQSFIASNGRIVTDSDLRVKRWAYGEAEEGWRDGEMTSEQLYNFWKNYDHGAAVGEYVAALERNVARARQEEIAAQEAVRQLQQLVEIIRQEIGKYEQVLDQLKKDLDECVKRCKEKAEDYVRNPPIPPPTPPQNTCRDTPPCCDFYKMLSRYGARTLSDWADIANNQGYRENLGITDQQLTILRKAETACTGSSTPPPSLPTLPVGGESPPLPPPTPPKSCSETCSSIGMYNMQPDYTSYIQSQLSSVECVSAVRVTVRTTSKDGCTCYPRNPEVAVSDSTKPVCRDTFCGDVPCGETRTCQESSDGVIAAYSATCSWEGWGVSGTTVTPLVGVSG
ncbi:MAG TPA: hypothetical protein VJK52_04690, partial [Candidatus Nanoarchaeia archaeon]|nr:hypothetical protein [Candidatus Nanoarchaeia archaeon]